MSRDMQDQVSKVRSLHVGNCKPDSLLWRLTLCRTLSLSAQYIYHSQPANAAHQLVIEDHCQSGGLKVFSHTCNNGR